MPPALVVKYCPVDERPYTGKTEKEAIEKVREHLRLSPDEAHQGVYNTEGWWNDYGN